MSWGYEIFCDRYGAGSDLKDLYGRTFNPAFWKHRNLDGLALWMDRSNGAHSDFLPQDHFGKIVRTPGKLLRHMMK